MTYKIQLKTDTAANYASVNPTLAMGEVGYISDLQTIKIGNGVDAWNDLAFPAGFTGIDSAAVHLTVGGEISGITEKVTPDNADKILIEDSADDDKKKYIQIGSLLGMVDYSFVAVPQTIISYTNGSGIESIETTDSIWVLNTGALTGNKIAQGIKITCRKSGVDRVYTFSEDIDLGTLSANTTYYVVLEINSGSENKSILASSDVTVHLLSYPMYWKNIDVNNRISKNDMTSNSDGGYTVSASSSNSTHNPYKACDGITSGENNCWEASSSTNQWWKLQLPSSKICKKVVIFPRTGWLSRAPKDFTIEGSNDDTNWTTLGTFTGETSWVAGIGNEYSLNNTTAYLYYRVNISTNNGGEYINFSEIEFYEIPTNVFHYNGRDCFIGDVADFSDPTNAKTCIMLGEITTDATEVTDVVTYAFNGKKKITQTTTSGNTATITHDIGVKDTKVKVNENSVLKHKDITLINQNSLSYSSTYSGSSIVTVSREDVA